MDLNIFNTSKSQNDITGTFSDVSKVNVITEKLCEKRKVIEDTIKTCDDSILRELATELLEIKKDMMTFGISETDYQIHLVKNKNTSNS